ncbi:MAG: conjugal transfer protein TraF [Bacilli bacterium]|nr:conjugal transfer protein TraF [Bacilli bacterium]MDD4282921.1 conjugal transfer protein TraF [Bacilli bacterium]
MENKQNDYIHNTLKRVWGCIIAILIMTFINTGILLSNPSLYSNNEKPEGDINIDYDTSAFKETTANELVNNTKDEISVVFIGSASCGWCLEFAPVLTEATEQYNLNTLYLDISKINDQETVDMLLQLETVSGLENFMQENFGATPMILIMEDGKILDADTGYKDITTFSSYLEEQGFEK